MTGSQSNDDNNNNNNETTAVGNQKDYNFIVYTDSGMDFYLSELDAMSGIGVINGDTIKFHPEHIVAVRTKKKT